MPRLSDEQLNDIRRYLLAGNTISVPWAIVSLSDTLNTIDALKADLASLHVDKAQVRYCGHAVKCPICYPSDELATARAETAAMLERAADLCNKDGDWHLAEKIRALITTDQAAALAEHDADLRDSVIATCEAMLEGDTNRPEYQKFMKAVAEHDRRLLCGTAAVDTSTNAVTHLTAKDASPSEELLLLPDAKWNQLTLESQAIVRKWFQLAAEGLQAILDEPEKIAEREREVRLETLKKVEKIFMWHDGVPNLRNYLNQELAELRATAEHGK